MEKSALVSTHRLSIAEVKDGVEWSALEQDVLAACRTGDGAVAMNSEVVAFSDPPTAEEMVRAYRPKDSSDPERRVRAGLIRYLLLGGCDAEDGARPHPKGVRLSGGWIDGALDFQGCDTQLDLSLQHCQFPQKPSFQDAHLGGLYLRGSRCAAGLNLHRLDTETDVHLAKGFHCTGLTDLVGAKIGGQLSCAGGKFDGNDGKALNGTAMKVGADVFFSSGFQAIGDVNISAAQITGRLSCSGGRFSHNDNRPLVDHESQHRALTGFSVSVGSDVFMRTEKDAEGNAVRACQVSGLLDFRRARIGGDLRLHETKFDGAVVLESARISEGLFWQGVEGAVDWLNLTEAKVGVLRDDVASWQRVKTYLLSGFTYDTIQSPMGIAERLDWLKRKAERRLPEEMIDHLRAQPWREAEQSDFDPQPYSQLAKVLGAQGNRSGAARVLELRETKLRAAAQRRAMGRVDGEWRGGVASLPATGLAIWDFMFRWLFGYGHKPARALIWVFGIWLFGLWLYSNAYAAGQMAPNSDVIVSSPHWIAAVARAEACGGCVQPLTLWLDSPDAQDYETFSAGLYALDLFVPLDALGQESTWAPSMVRGGWGTFGYWARMPIQLMGWIITAVGAAVLTGLVGRKD
jgi:hypothetical protein